MRLTAQTWAKPLPDKSRLYVFPGVDGQWYWNRIAANGQKIAAGGEGFTRKWSAKRAALRSVK